MFPLLALYAIRVNESDSMFNDSPKKALEVSISRWYAKEQGKQEVCMKWYNSALVVVLACLLLPPVGIVLIWVHPRWTQKAKIVWSLIVGFYSMGACSRYRP